MAAAAVFAELKLRDGKTERISVKTGNGLTSLMSGIQQLRADVSRLLNDLVEREKGREVCAVDEEEEDEDDSDEEDPPDSDLQPPLKRHKTRDYPEDR